MQRTRLVCLALCAWALLAFGQTNGNSTDTGSSGGGGIDFTNLSPQVDMPVFNARFTLGFNYDFLRSPTQVSFDYPKGYMGFDLPLGASVNPFDIVRSYNAAIDSMFADSTIMSNGSEYQPKAMAQQHPVSTVRVDVPLLGGVGTFSNIQNIYVSYLNTIGLPNTKLAFSDSSTGINLAMRGAIAVPLDIAMTWETMTFGYAYKLTPDWTVALNLNRHVFRANASANINVNLLGYLSINQQGIGDSIPINYSVGGVMNANYVAESWSPTLAVKWGRLGLTSRFGVKTKARGEMHVDYSLPFFIDAKTFKSSMTESNLTDLKYLGRMKTNDINTFTHDSKDMVWQLPDAHTLSFDLAKNKLFVSYTKMVGEIKIGMDNFWLLEKAGADSTQDTIGLDLGIKVDNIIMMTGDFRNFFFNVGVFTLDFNVPGTDGVLGKALKSTGYVMLQGAPLVPVLNFGSAIGSKMQLMVEIDVLPFMALKSGVNYYF